MNDNHADVLLASAANKKKSERLQLVFIIAAVFLAFLFSIFMVLSSGGSVDPSDDYSAEPAVIDRQNIDEKSLAGNKSQDLEELLQRYRKDIEPALQLLPRQTIFGERAVDIQNQVNDLVENIEDHAVLKPQLNDEIIKAESLLSKYAEEVNSALDRLDKAFETFNVNGFERELSNLLMLAKNNEEVQRWSVQKNKVLKYFKYAQRASRAKAELKVELELESLREIDKLGFADSELSARINELQNIVAEQRFAKHIKFANIFLAEKKLKQASEEISKASAIFPKRPQVIDLKATIAVELKKANVANLIKTAENYAVLDQWRNAKQTYSKALAVISTSKLAIDGYQLSKSILETKAQLEDILNQPLRLKSAEVMKYAEQVLANSVLYASYSQSLAAVRMQVEELVEQKMLPRSVWVESDARAKIKVQGVGYIKPTRGKFVNLKPGDYLFYAECKGHKTQMYRVSIPLEGEILPIKVICGNSL